MSKQASEFQEKTMALLYRGKEIFKPLNTGRIDDHVGAVEADSDGLFRTAKLYIGEVENPYLTVFSLTPWLCLYLFYIITPEQEYRKSGYEAVLWRISCLV